MTDAVAIAEKWIAFLDSYNPCDQELWYANIKESRTLAQAVLAGRDAKRDGLRRAAEMVKEWGEEAESDGKKEASDFYYRIADAIEAKAKE